MLVAAAGGGLLVLGWLLLPLVFFGVDETLDPARFALLPLPRRTLVTGLFVAALISVPVLAVLIASFGLVLTAWSLGGWSAGLVAVVGVLAGLLLCVAASRAVTSAFATMLRSRRVRDLAAVLLAVTAALLGPLQVFGLAALREADWDPADPGRDRDRLDAVRRAVDRRHRRGPGAGVGGTGQVADHGGGARRPAGLVVAVAGVGDGGCGERR